MLNENSRMERMIQEARNATRNAAENITKYNAKRGDMDLTDVILQNNYKSIGESVFTNEEIPDEVALAAVSICRRRFKQEDIVLLDVLDNDEEGESGVAFTKDKLYYWEEDENYKGALAYADIVEVDYDESVVYVTTASERLEIFCGYDNNSYCRQMYNFLMDIMEGVAAIIKENGL